MTSLYIVVQVLQIICNMDSVDLKNNLEFIFHTCEDRNGGESKLLGFYGRSIKERKEKKKKKEQCSQYGPESWVERDCISSAPVPQSSAGKLFRTERGSAL